MEIQDTKSKIIDSYKASILSLQLGLLQTAEQLNLVPELSEMVRFSVKNLNPVHEYLNLLKTTCSDPKCLIFIDSEGRAFDLIAGEAISGNDVIDKILDNITTIEI